MATSPKYGLVGPPQLNSTTTTTVTVEAPLGFTQNNSLTYTSTSNPCLDFFFQVVPDTPEHKITSYLLKAWEHDPLTTLKLICNLRGIRGTGKSNKEGFFTCAMWLHKEHPKTLAFNLKSLANFGCFKDLLEILFRLLEGENVRSKWKNARDASRCRSRSRSRSPIRKRNRRPLRRRGMVESKQSKEAKKATREDRIRKDLEEGEEKKAKAREERKGRDLAKAKKALARYKEDHDYRVLHDRVAGVFALFLREDVKNMNSGEFSKISLASKWCPNLDSAYDKTTLICESIARKVFPKEEFPEYEGVEDAYYAYRVRDRLRKQVLVPLRKVLQLPEVYMSANQWGSLPYNRVPSVAIKTYKDLFLRHDPKRFLKYLDDVKKGNAKVAAGALLPHEILASVKHGGSELSELQWNRMVEDLTKSGKLKNCLAVCDVSGSMRGTPMDVCVALGLLISELSEDPWKGKVITFSHKPKLHLIEGDDLRTKTNFIREMDSGYNTDFQKVFDQILRVAVKNKLKSDEMVKRVFVFTDMEFDEASGHINDNVYASDSGDSSDCREFSGSYNSEDEVVCRRGMKRRYDAEKCKKKGWETDFEAIQRTFKEKGFEKVPEIVFWNLRSSEATPVTAIQKGALLLSGFSKNLVKLFFERDGIFTPIEAMQLAISRNEYQELDVYD